MRYIHIVYFPSDSLSINTTSSALSPVAGDSTELTCSVTLPPQVMGNPVFQWAGPGDIPTPAEPSTSGQVVTSLLILNSIRTSQAGQYTCTVTVNNTLHMSNVDIAVQSKYKTSQVICPLELQL